MFFLYRILINLLLLISPIIIIFRILKKKEDPIRFQEKFCSFTLSRKKEKLIWFHGASVGEILSVIPLIRQLEKNKDIDQILVTSNTLSSSKIFSKLKLKKTIHQFYPIDSNYFTKKFLEYWKPSIAIFIDSEVWPNMIINIKNKSIPLILLNARITKKSFNKWMLFNSYAKKIFSKFNLCLTSNNKSKKYLKLLGAKKVIFLGNLKFSNIEGNETVLNKDLVKFFKTKKIWCASSTHKQEEILCARVHNQLKKKYKNLLTIIIPRHIDRIPSILDELEKLNLKVHLHESKNKVSKNTDIYLVNSYGKTKSFYKISKTVFLGGSMIKHGGQNPIEPAIYGSKIFYGPYNWNFDEIYDLLDSHKVSKKINNMNELSYNIQKFFIKNNKSNKIKSKIKKLGSEILIQSLKQINFFIKK